MKLEALIDSQTKVGTDEGIEQVQKFINHLKEEGQSTSSVIVSDIQPKRGLFDTSYFASLTVDLLVGATSGLISNFIYQYFKTLKKDNPNNDRIDREINQNKIEINVENFSVIFIISNPDVDDLK
jgi:hypothetical protein